jgi:chaperonin GroES
MTGEVLSTGNGKVQENGERQSLDVKAGDKVLFGKYSGTEVKVDGEEVLVMREDDIMGVIEG